MAILLRLVVGLTLAAVMHPSFAAGQAPPAPRETPPGNPPGILIAATIDNQDNLVLVEYQTIYIGFGGERYNTRSVSRVPLKEVRIMTVGGGTLTIAAARDRLGGKDTPVLVSPWKAPIPDFYAAMFHPQTLHFVFPKKAPQWRPIEDPSGPLR